MPIDADIQRVLELSQQGQSLQDKANEELSALRNKIRSGKKTTGDPVKDFQITFFGELEKSELGKKLRDLYETIEAHQDQPVLVITGEEHIGGCTGFGGKGHYQQNTNLQLGVLNSNLTFDLKKGNLLIPTSAYVTRRERDEEWTRHKGPIVLSGYEFSFIDKDLPDRGFLEPVGNIGSLSNSLRVLTGKEDVGLYFRIPNRHFQNAFVRKKKGEDISEWLEAFGHMDTSYAPALAMIGGDVPDTFREKYVAEQKAKRAGIIKTLQEYHSGAQNGSRNGDNIRRTLTDAVKLGMHKDTHKITLEPGHTLDVPEYITGLCRDYKVKIPK